MLYVECTVLYCYAQDITKNDAFFESFNCLREIFYMEAISNVYQSSHIMYTAHRSQYRCLHHTAQQERSNIFSQLKPSLLHTASHKV